MIPELNHIECIKQVQENYELRFCREDEIDEVADFIRKYWKEDHILVKSRELLDWQHYEPENHRYSIVITKDKKTGEICSTLGVAKTSHFDPAIKNHFVWTAIWCSRKDIHVKGLGIALYYFLKEELDPETVVGIGANPETLRYYESWGFTIGTMQQYFMINEEVSAYHLVELHDAEAAFLPEGENDKDKEIIPVTHEEFCAMEENAISQYGRYKSRLYYINRYIRHPMYEYLFYKIVKKDQVLAVVVTRECFAENTAALRIVDYAGDCTAIEGTAAKWQQLIRQKNYEYVDFICRGKIENSLKKAGFRNRKEYDVVIPNYFEPFWKQNVDLLYFYKTLCEGMEEELVKGDADQDRPNLVP